MTNSTQPSGAIYVAATERLSASDPVFGRAIARIGRCKLGDECQPASTTFQALLKAITYQQLSTKAAATIYARVCALAPDLKPERYRDLAASTLREAGLSRAKVLSVHDLAMRVCSGEVPSMGTLKTMEDAEIIESLTKIRGIGRWSAEMLLIFRLGRLDVLPVQDLGVQRGFSATFRKSKKPVPEALEHRGERWRPYRSVASWFLWRAADSAR